MAGPEGRSIVRIRTLLLRLCLLFLLSYGFLYFSYKWLDPTQVVLDFPQYYGMVLHPFDLHAAPSPFVYRQLTTMVASALWHLHVYYPDKIRFFDPRFDQRIFFAVLLTNYLGVLLAACAAMAITEDAFAEPEAGLASGRSGDAARMAILVAGLLCFFDFYLQVMTLTGQADGLSWALLGWGYYFYRRSRLLPFALLMGLTIIQREIMPLIFLVFLGCALWQERGRMDGPRRRFLVRAGALCILAFASYLTWKHLSHVPGNEYQTDPAAQAGSVLHFRLDRAYVMQVLIGQNLLLVLALLWAAAYRRSRRLSDGLLPLALNCAMLIAVSILARISNNAGRMLALLTPVVAFELTMALVGLDRSAPDAALPGESRAA
jgi:hypothetical protein